MEEDNVFDLLQRYRRDRHVLLNFILSGSLIKKVVLPPGAVSLEDVDIDQVSVDYAINCVRKGETLDLAEAIRLYHDSLDFPSTSNSGSAEEFFLITNPESSGSAPTRAPPSIPVPKSPILNNLANSESFHSPHEEEELTVDDIDDFEDDDEDIENVMGLRRQSKDFSDLMLGLPSFSTGITDDDLRESAYEILVACAGAAGGLIVPYNEKKKESKRTRLIKKLARSKNDNVASHSQQAHGLVGLLDVMRAQLEECFFPVGFPLFMYFPTEYFLNSWVLPINKRPTAFYVDNMHSSSCYHLTIIICSIFELEYFLKCLKIWMMFKNCLPT